MNYFYDTEFLEGPQSGRGRDMMTIDLISIGIVSEDGREYYAICSDFNFSLAWNSFQIEEQSGDMRNIFPEGKKVYWIRENVLKKVYHDLCAIQKESSHKHYDFAMEKFDFDNMYVLLRQHGISKYVIGTEILAFIPPEKETPVLYAYYSAYDHVVFCWIWGKMIDLPKGMPMYTRDLKQMIDEKASQLIFGEHGDQSLKTLENVLSELKQHPDYPKNENDHNALEDARWNKKLFDFLKSI